MVRKKRFNKISAGSVVNKATARKQDKQFGLQSREEKEKILQQGDIVYAKYPPTNSFYWGKISKRVKVGGAKHSSIRYNITYHDGDVWPLEKTDERLHADDIHTMEETLRLMSTGLLMEFPLPPIYKAEVEALRQQDISVSDSSSNYDHADDVDDDDVVMVDALLHQSTPKKKEESQKARNVFYDSEQDEINAAKPQASTPKEADNGDFVMVDQLRRQPTPRMAKRKLSPRNHTKVNDFVIVDESQPQTTPKNTKTKAFQRKQPKVKRALMYTPAMTEAASSPNRIQVKITKRSELSVSNENQQEQHNQQEQQEEGKLNDGVSDEDENGEDWQDNDHEASDKDGNGEDCHDHDHEASDEDGNGEDCQDNDHEASDEDGNSKAWQDNYYYRDIWV